MVYMYHALGINTVVPSSRIFLIGLAGFPTATTRSSVSFVTTDPAPIVTPFPIFTPGPNDDSSTYPTVFSYEFKGSADLKHLSLGENVIIDSLSPTDEGGIYTLQPKFNVLTSIIKLSYPAALCINWPETYGRERSSDPDEGGSLIDWFVPELLHNLDEDTCSIKEIRIHVRYNNIGHMISRMMGYGPEWRPKIKLNMVNPPEILLEGILNNVFWSVVNAMNALIEEDIHFDSTMIGEPFSFNLVDNGKISDAIDTVAEDVWDDYENLYDTVKDAITWKKQDNEDDWKCGCEKHVPNWKVISKWKSPTPNSEVVDHTQRKIDEYFKPIKKDS